MWGQKFGRAVLAAAALIVSGTSRAGAGAGADGGYTDVPLDRVKAEVTEGKAKLVDVREVKEWDRGHIKGASLVPLSQLMAWDRDGLKPAERAELEKTLPKGSVVYCHCAAGARSLPGGEFLKKLGYDARPLRQGYQALVGAGFPKDGGK